MFAGAISGRALHLPLINDEMAVHPYPHAIVYGHAKLVGAGIEVRGTRPAHREVVGGQTRRWGATPPIVIDVALISG